MSTAASSTTADPAKDTNATTDKPAKRKVSFKLPHLLWIMIGLIVIMTALTYVIPAGNFARDASGKIDATQFTYLGHQTPVSAGHVAMILLDAIAGVGVIIFTVMALGANMAVILDTGAIDEFLNWAIYKLKDQSVNVLLPFVFFLMAYLGAFGGSDALIAVVPIGVIFAKKLKLDPFVALGVTTLATMIGFGTGPTKQIVPQAMLEVPIYSGFFMRFVIMNVFTLLGLAYVFWYTKRIIKDPNKSLMGNTDWLTAANDASQDDGAIHEVHLSWRSILVLIIFVLQFVAIVAWGLIAKERVFEFTVAASLIGAILAGICSTMTADEIGNSFAKGLADMAFVGFVIGLASVVSIVMREGNIVDTIVYVLTRPLLDLDKGIASIGITAVIAVLNPIIPSATSKAAILIPIISPVVDALGLSPQLAVQAFQFGDGFTNLLSPALGWTIGSTVIAGVEFGKWIKWVLPITIACLLLSFVWMYGLTMINWTGL